MLYPAVMALPSHERDAAFAALAEVVPVHVRATDTCPPADLCQGAEAVQALPRLPVPPTLLFALTMVVLAMRWQSRLRPEQRDWWWPPARRRALLQVFLI